MKFLKTFLADESGDIVQSLGWIVAVSLGAVAIGGLVYSGMKTLGTKTQTKLNGIDGGDVFNPSY